MFDVDDKTICAKITISRMSNDMIRIAIWDEASRCDFVVAEMTPEKFGFAVTGLAHMEATCEVRGLENVGKEKIVENRAVVVDDAEIGRDRALAKQWIDDNCQEEGWVVDSYLGSQGSVVFSPAGTFILNYRVYKYVEQGA